ncbi:DUF2309 domain-containing protein [Alicyclobacillus herbarius]|uniref:DUF2309 domain-containing protein n=1 Tax=Alicyclobacillus herbarius TaxID=122960 RepID=UPI00047AAD03|nr:DUF2309 domain-containing protein [Alicyclobacillus herbarius]
MSKTVLTLERVERDHVAIWNERDGASIQEQVRRAADAIAPVWPLSTFIARHPWPNLEHLPFAAVAETLYETQGTFLYPSPAVVSAALERGEIQRDLAEQRLVRWLDKQPLPMPRPQAERLCRALLWSVDGSLEATDEGSAEAASPELLRLAEDAVQSGIAPDREPVRKPVSAKLKTLGARLDQQMIKWCKLFLDEGEALWRLPGREGGLYRAWRYLVSVDPALSKEERERLDGWPQEATEGLLQALDKLGVTEDVEAYLRAHLLALPGWGGMLWWHSQQAGLDTAWLLEYLAVRLSLEWALCAPYLPLLDALREPADTAANAVLPLLHAWCRWGGITPKAWRDLHPEAKRAGLAWIDRFVRIDRWHIWLEAWEETYEAHLRESLCTHSSAEPAQPAVAQLLFCIDVRSDAFRRHIEQSGPFETYGCAGFFNLPIRTRALDSVYAHPSCPPIVAPEVEVRESAADAESVMAYRQRRNAARFVGRMFKKTKQHVLASLALPELSGPWLGMSTLLRTVAPSGTGRLLRLADELVEQKPPTRLSLFRASSARDATARDVTTGASGVPVGMTAREMVDAVGGLLRSVGLTSFAPLVVVCGHESQTVNNPHAAALDCGACGGAAGSFNARVFAALCNLPEVRDGLAREGICIPEDTVFVAAEHVTTTDELRWLDIPDLPHAARDAKAMLTRALQEARWHTNVERMEKLPHASSVLNPVREMNRRATDWSEIRPEWGLAGNASFVIGSRRLTASAELHGRAFLHSYDWRVDPDGDCLASIIGGPVTVAQWINLQYYASTVAPHVHGSGNKATQTVTGGIGVMQGNSSDLLTGLPWQSVAASDGVLFHRPLRLLVVIEAPRAHIERLLRHDPEFCLKVKNGWLRLASIDPESNSWITWEPDRVDALLVHAV